MAAALILCAPARDLALAQFSTPYDPDFPPAAEKPAPAPHAPQLPGGPPPAPGAPPVPEELPPVTFILPETAGPFLLLDRPDKDHILEAPPPAEAPKPREFVEFEEGLKPYDYSFEKWRTMRKHLEEGIVPTEGEIIPYISGVPVAISTAPPKPPPPEVELPTYGTSLSITGRKVIGVSYMEKKFLRPQTTSNRPQSTNLIEITQQLQLRMQGKVGPKITVNVDYDDTKLNHQDISVVYTGDPDEVVQNVSFGDIDLSLPATEFVSYNKQLFGIRADIKYKGLKSSFVASRTKGTTKSRQFFGNTQFVTTDILDTAYVRRQNYDLSFGNSARLPIKPGSERVFLATQIQGQTNVNTGSLVVNDLQVPSSSFTTVFQQLNAGQDYTIDYIKGIITFRTPLSPQFAVAIDFVDAGGNALSVEQSTSSTAAGPPTCTEPANFGLPGLRPGSACPKLIKTPSDVPISTATEVGFNRELKTFYNIGQSQIVRDNGRGNFILKVLDQNRVETGSALNPVQKYPDTIQVDFENGTFRLISPFAVVADSSTADPDIYAPTPISKRIIHVEYSYRFKTFFLEPNLVPQSEVVLLDNIKLNRNVDYFIDYDAGFVTFFNEDRIRTQSEIDITYEVAPFANLTNESLLGGRVSYDFNKHYSLGSTVLYEAGVKSPTVPSITDLARSLLVYEVDSQVQDIKLTRKLKMTAFRGEYARSEQNLNLNGDALIDNMEGIKQEDPASPLATSWFIAANPGGRPTDPTKINWVTESIPVLTINRRAQASPSETQPVLDLQYDFSNPVSTEASIVSPFSISGNDFSQKTILEVVMLGDNSLNELNFRLGAVNEDADGTGGATLICGDGRVLANSPKTEDANCDAILQPSEDVGWLFSPATTPSARYGATNGRIDTEDLNANGRLDPDDGNGGDFGYLGNPLLNPSSNNQLFDITNNQNHTMIDFGTSAGDWRTFQIPLNISSATVSRWTNIKHIRISVRHRAGGSLSGTLRFARVAVVGNSWQRGQAADPATNSSPVNGESLVVTPVNSVDNPNYVPIFNAAGDAASVFAELYGSLAALQQQSNSKNVSEQALQLDFSSMTIAASSSVVTTKRLFTKPIDISQHKYFNFLLYGNADSSPGTTCALPNSGANATPNCTDHTFFLRVGDDHNFFEVRVPLNYVGWKKITVLQADTGGRSIANQWLALNPGTVVISSGSPSLQQVAEIVAGVRRTTSTTAGSDAASTRGRVFLDEIYVSNPIPRVGEAKKIDINFEYAGWGSFGAKYREVDRNFQTPTSVVLGQDNRQDSAYLNLSRIPYFPMAFNLSRAITDTPNTAQTGSLSNLVNLLSQGRVTTWSGSAQGNFSLGAYPRMGLNYTRNRIEYELLTRLDDRKTYSGTLQYSVPVNSRFLPKTIDSNFSFTRYDVSFRSPQSLSLPGNFNTNEFTQTLGLRMSFMPWTGSTFNPNYSLTKVRENRADFTSGAELDLRYPKSLNQTIGFTSNYRLLSWLNPQVNYSIDTIENNILSVSTFVVQTSTFVFNVGQIKTLNRSANGAVNLPLTIGEIFRRTKLFKSLNIVSSYQLQDGDVWNNVEKDLDSQWALWVRTPLHPASPAAVRQTATFRDTFQSTQRWSPLDAYNITGRKAAFKTLSISNNYVRSIQRTDVTGTVSKTLSTTLPDAVATLGQIEKLLHSEKWMSNTQLNFKYSAHKTENVGQSINTDRAIGTDLRSIIRKRFDTLLSFNDRVATNKNLLVDANTQETTHQDATVQTTFDLRKVRFTPKTDYTHDTTALGTGVKTQDVTVITPSLLVRADVALPRGLRLPGSTKTILFTNRIIWTTTLSLAQRSSPVTVADNSRLFSFNTSGDYEIAKNVRMTLNGAMSRLWHKFLKEEDFMSYQFGTTLTLQF